MECSLCYEKFIYPNSSIELEELFENYNNINSSINERENFIKFMNFVITTRHNRTMQCETEKCNSIICFNCWTKYTDRENESIDGSFDKTLDKCPFCRQVYWKYYMKNIVHSELLMKVLNEDEFINIIMEKMII